MYQNSYMLDRLARQKEEIENLMRNYQNTQQPMNVFNVGNQQVDFEARMITKDDKPNEIMVQRKTAFICLENGKLYIKELNGDVKDYDIVIPKTPEELENEELKAKVKELERELKERNSKK